MSVDAYDIIELKHDGDGSFSQDFLVENCRQCRNDEGGYDHENCVDEVAALASDFAYLQNEDDNLYRTMDDKKCWNQETYDTWLKKKLTNPVTRQKLKIPVPDGIPQISNTNIFRSPASTNNANARENETLASNARRIREDKTPYQELRSYDLNMHTSDQRKAAVSAAIDARITAVRGAATQAAHDSYALAANERAVLERAVLERAARERAGERAANPNPVTRHRRRLGPFQEVVDLKRSGRTPEALALFRTEIESVTQFYGLPPVKELYDSGLEVEAMLLLTKMIPFVTTFNIVDVMAMLKYRPHGRGEFFRNATKVFFGHSLMVATEFSCWDVVELYECEKDETEHHENYAGALLQSTIELARDFQGMGIVALYLKHLDEWANFVFDNTIDLAYSFGGGMSYHQPRMTATVCIRLAYLGLAEKARQLFDRTKFDRWRGEIHASDRMINYSIEYFEGDTLMTLE